MSEDQPDDCRSSFDEEYLQDYLNQVSSSLKISGEKYSINLGTKKGDNYSSIVYRVSIDGEKDEKTVKISTIVKLPPKDERGRLISQVSHFFPREHFFYLEIVPIFKEFLKQKNKSLENVGECYFSSIDDHKEMICLEDLRSKGFVMRDRMKQLDFEHTSLAFRALGRLHALSFALRDQKPDIFKSKITTLKEGAFRPEVIANPTVMNRYEALGKLVRMTLSEEDPKYTERFDQYFKGFRSHMERSCDGSKAEPYAVLGHGDFSMNNMLFKYEKDSTEPQDIYFLDFQLSRYASPAVDISYALFCSCSQELRENHFDSLIKIYYESLSSYLVELGSDPEKLFPYEALLLQLTNFSIYSAGIGMLVIPAFISKDDNDRDDVQGHNHNLIELEKRIHRDSFLRNTFRHLYKDLIDRNYI